MKTKNKIKALLATLLAVVGVVSVGLGVKAQVISSTFTFSDILPEVKNGETGKATATDSTTKESLDLTIENKYDATIKFSSSGGTYLNVKNTDPTKYVSFTFATRGSGKLIVSKFTTQNITKYATLTLYKGDQIEKSQKIACKDVDQEFDLLEASTYSLYFYGDSSQASNLKFASLIITDKYDDSEYSVNYDLDGGLGDISNTKYDKSNSSFNLPASIPTKLGYLFGGWSDGTKTYDAGASYTFDEKVTKYDFKAVWNVDPNYTFDITYDALGGVASRESDLKIPFESNISLPTAYRYGYTFKGWTDGKEIYTDTYKATTDITLKAVWEDWDDFEDLSLSSNELINVYYFVSAKYGDRNTTGSTNQITERLELSNSVYTIQTGCEMYKTTKTYNGVSYNSAINTKGALNKEANCVSFTSPCDGIFKVVLTSAGQSARNIIFSSNGTDSLVPVEGEELLKINANDAKSYVFRTLTFNVSKGVTYYLGGDNGIRIFSLAINEMDLSLEQQETENGDSIRYVATISNVDASQIASWTVEMTLEGQTEKNIETFSTIYKSVSGTNGKEAKDNTYYLVATLTGIPSKFNGKILSTKIILTLVDGTTLTSNSSDYTLAVKTEEA